MIKLLVPVKVVCDHCNSSMTKQAEVPIGLDESELAQNYILDDWRENGTWLYDSVTKRIFCSGWCAEEFRNAHGVSDG